VADRKISQYNVKQKRNPRTGPASPAPTKCCAVAANFDWCAGIGCKSGSCASALKRGNAIRENGVPRGLLFGFVGEGEFGFFVQD